MQRASRSTSYGASANGATFANSLLHIASRTLQRPDPMWNILRISLGKALVELD